MKEPTDRMLIDALCIIRADDMGLIDRSKNDGAFFVKRAREIVGQYAPIAISRMRREQESAHG